MFCNQQRFNYSFTVKLLVGNKCDDVEERCVTEEEAKSFAGKVVYDFMKG